MTLPFSCLPPVSPARMCRTVVVTTVVCLALVTPIAYGWWGWIGAGAVVAAALCCCVGPLGALGVALAFRGRDRCLGAVLPGMLVRMGVALTAATGVQLTGGPLAEAGFLYYLLMFYLVTLAAETVVVVRAWST